MNWHGPIIQKNIVVPEDMHVEIGAEARRRHMKIWEAYRQGMTAWLFPESPAYSRNQRHHDLLESVLTQDPEAARCITGALELVAEAVRSRRPSVPAAKAR